MSSECGAIRQIGLHYGSGCNNTTRSNANTLAKNCAAAYKGALAHCASTVDDGSGRHMTVRCHRRIMLDQCAAIDDAVLPDQGARIDDRTMENHGTLTDPGMA